MVLALATAPVLSGCVHASAKTSVDTPPLEMPAPPPRVVETVEVIPPAPLALPEEPPRQPIRPPAPAPAPARPAPRAEAPARQEPAPKVEPPADEAPRSTATLQATRAGAEGEVVRRIRGVIDSARADLNRVNSQALTRDGRTQYNTAKRFIEQAEEALTKRNLVLAQSLAGKALAVAAQLVPR